jgi:hypothetical protein
MELSGTAKVLHWYQRREQLNGCAFHSSIPLPFLPKYWMRKKAGAWRFFPDIYRKPISFIFRGPIFW